jgi:hypothetical protein
MNPDYKAFLASKSIRATERGLRSVPALAPHLFQFQSHCVDFALRSGCSGLFLDTGLGKTECQLEWCQKVIEATNRPALILTPLAVAWQTHRRAEQWGYEARVIRDQSGVGKRIRRGIARRGVNLEILHRQDDAISDQPIQRRSIQTCRDCYACSERSHGARQLRRIPRRDGSKRNALAVFH